MASSSEPEVQAYNEALVLALRSCDPAVLRRFAQLWGDRLSNRGLKQLAKATDAVVESQPLRCTHFDAFRFFTPAAVPRNRLELTRPRTIDNDQPGCLHVVMDLYRFAYKLGPFCPSPVLGDAFELAADER